MDDKQKIEEGVQLYFDSMYESSAEKVRQAFYGLEVQNFQRGRDEVKVFIRYPDSERKTIENLESMFIRTQNGSEIPFRQLATLEFSKGFSSIRRVDRSRAINVTANVDISKITSNEVLSSLQQNDLPEILNLYPSVNYSLEGEQREQCSPSRE